jgi:signal transduction histidine kinase
MADSSFGTILLFGGQPDAALEIKTALEHWQLCVPVAQSLTELPDRVGQEDPDLMLLDGFATADYGLLIQQVRQIVTDRPIALLLDEEDWDALSTSGITDAIDDVLFKPISEMALAAQLRFRLKTYVTQRQLRQKNRVLIQEQQDSVPVNVLKDSIVSNVSHELRTPLLQIKSAVAMLSESTRGVSNEHADLRKLTDYVAEANKLLTYMTAATSKLEGVVQDITQLAQALNLKREAFQIQDAISLAQRQLTRRWESSGEAQRIRVLFSEQYIVWGDRAGVSQVLQQLLDNGIKFSRHNNRPIEINAWLAPEGLWISVRDYGIGIAADQREKIFQAFYQVDPSSTRPFGGVGVGLAIVKLILDALDSPIDVKSELGKGSTFSFLLPIARL